MPINIDFLSNVSAFLRGAGDVETALEDVSGSLDDLARDAQRNNLDGALDDARSAADRASSSVRDLESAASDAASEVRDIDRKPLRDVERAADDASSTVRDLESAASDAASEVKDIDHKSLDDAERAGDDLERKFKDLADAAKDTSRKTQDAGDDMRKGFKHAEDGVSEFKDEANSTARETAASFDGSAESVVGAFQEVAANAFAGFGPAGSVAGLAAAAGIGAAVSGFTAVEEAAAENRQAASDWATSWIDAGSTVATAGAVVGGVLDIIGDDKKRAEAEHLRDIWGVDLPTAMRVMAGSTTDLEVAQHSLNDRIDKLATLTDDASVAQADLATQQLFANDTTREGSIELQKYRDRQALATQYAEAGSAALRGYAENAEGATVEVDRLGNKVYTLPDKTQIFVDAETGTASRNIDDFQGDVDGIPETVSTTINAYPQIVGMQAAVDSAARSVIPPNIAFGSYISRTNFWE